MDASLRGAGLPTHSTEVTRGGSCLGWELAYDAPTCRAAPHSMWRLCLGILELLRRGWATGRQVSVLVGHFTSKALLRRELLAGLSAVYAFSGKCWASRSDRWPNARRELRWCSSFSFLAHRDLAADWAPSVSVLDASWWGRGVMQKRVTQDMCALVGQYSDRWRFGFGDEPLIIARAEALGDRPAPRSRVPRVPRRLWGGSWCRA